MAIVQRNSTSHISPALHNARQFQMSFLSNIATAFTVARTVDHDRLARDEAYRLAIVALLRGNRSAPRPRVEEAPEIRRAA
jgi:hypothetical protein